MPSSKDPYLKMREGSVALRKQQYEFLHILPPLSIRSQWPEAALVALMAYASYGIRKKALQIAEISSTKLRKWIRKLPGYQRAWDDAREIAADGLEIEAYRRAVEGNPQPVYYRGEKIGTRKEYSDLLLLFLMKGARPEKYRDRAEIQHKGDLLGLKELARMAKKLRNGSEKAVITLPGVTVEGEYTEVKSND